MSVPDPQLAVIACPHCGTRYQVPRATLGAAGRVVQCAHCQNSWQAQADEPMAAAPAEDDRLFAGAAEEELDVVFETEEQAVAETDRWAPETPAWMQDEDEDGPTPTEPTEAAEPAPARPKGNANAIDPALTLKHRLAFATRQNRASQSLPLARLRRGARMATLAILVLMLGGGVLFRTAIVRQFPALADLYGAVGLGVNVIGLDFRNVTSLETLTAGRKVMKVTAEIYSVSASRTIVPPILVTLLDDGGAAVYEWSVSPDAADLDPDEVVHLDTQVNAPPPGATRVRLSFVETHDGAAPAPSAPHPFLSASETPH